MRARIGGLEPEAFTRPEYAVGGTFERTGRRCRLAARVERVADSEEIWSESYEFPWKRVSQVQDEVAERVAASVGSLLARAGERASTAEPHAYEAFVKARFSVLPSTPIPTTPSSWSPPGEDSSGR